MAKLEEECGDITVIGGVPASSPAEMLTRYENALKAIVALDFAKTKTGGDDFYSGPGRFISAWNIACEALGLPSPQPSSETAKEPS